MTNSPSVVHRCRQVLLDTIGTDILAFTRLVTLSQRQGEGERRAHSQFALDPDLAPVEFHERRKVSEGLIVETSLASRLRLRPPTRSCCRPDLQSTDIGPGLPCE